MLSPVLCASAGEIGGACEDRGFVRRYRSSAAHHERRASDHHPFTEKCQETPGTRQRPVVRSAAGLVAVLAAGLPARVAPVHHAGCRRNRFSPLSQDCEMRLGSLTSIFSIGLVAVFGNAILAPAADLAPPSGDSSILPADAQV